MVERAGAVLSRRSRGEGVLVGRAASIRLGGGPGPRPWGREQLGRGAGGPRGRIITTVSFRSITDAGLPQDFW